MCLYLVSADKASIPSSCPFTSNYAKSSYFMVLLIDVCQVMIKIVLVCLVPTDYHLPQVLTPKAEGKCKGKKREEEVKVREMKLKKKKRTNEA